jgi:hypothetical protein
MHSRTKSFLRAWGFLSLAFAVTGCMTSEEIQRERAEEMRQARLQEERKCLSFGFKRGTSDFSNCMLQLDIQKRNAAALRQASPPLTEKQCRDAGRMFIPFTGGCL